MHRRCALGKKPEGRNPRALGPEARRGGFGELGCVARRARWAENFVPKIPGAKKPSKRLSKNAWERPRESRAASQKGERRALEEAHALRALRHPNPLHLSSTHPPSCRCARSRRRESDGCEICRMANIRLVSFDATPMVRCFLSRLRSQLGKYLGGLLARRLRGSAATSEPSAPSAPSAPTASSAPSAPSALSALSAQSAQSAQSAP